MRNVLFDAVAFAAITFSPALAQQVPSTDLCASKSRPAFDVISIKPARPDSNFSMNRTPDGLSAASPIRQIIQYAYNLHDFQVTNGPDWLSNTAWEIKAKSDSPDPDLSQINDLQRQAFWDKHMAELQSMLVDRFHLQCHMATKEMPVYELVLAKGGSKLKLSTAEAGKRGNAWLNGHAGIFHGSGTGVGTDRIATLLSSPTGRLVLDKTGLTGTYDLTLDWSQDTGAGSPAGSDTPAVPSIFTAVEEQLGLHLQPAKAPVPVMVIDHIGQPAEN